MMYVALISAIAVCLLGGFIYAAKSLTEENS